LNALKEKKLVELKNRLSQLNGLGENIFTIFFKKFIMTIKAKKVA
jgi:hypothetical protein